MHIRPQAQILACGHASARAVLLLRLRRGLLCELLRAQRSSVWRFQCFQHLRGVKRLKLRLGSGESGCNYLIFSF